MLLKQAMGEFFEKGSHLNVVMDENGVILQVNAAWAAKLGWEQHELVNCTLTDLMEPNDVGTTQRMLDMVQEHNKQAEGFKTRLRDREGNYALLAWNFFRSNNRKFNFGVARVIGLR